MPVVSVIIPCRSIGYFLIFENLPAFDSQSYRQFEVIVLPNEHDVTEVNLLRKYKWLRVIPTGKVTRPAEKRDIGAQQAKGEILAFIDDDAYPTYDWLENAVHIFQNSTDAETDPADIAAICGPGILPPSAGYEEQVFDAVLRTRIGSGGYAYRFKKSNARYVDDFPSMNFLVRKDIFTKVGGFNSEYWPGEDSKLCEDIVYKENKEIYYTPDVTVYHHRRNDLTAFLKQHANYGFHRGAFMAHGDKNSKRISYLIPTAFVLYLLLLPWALWITKGDTKEFTIFAGILTFPLAFYALGEIYLFFKTAILKRSITIALGAVEVLFLTHLVYGILFLKGVWAGKIKKNNIYD